MVVLLSWYSFIEAALGDETMNQLVQNFVGLGPSEKHILNELLTRHIASKVIKCGDSVLDLGANVGFHTKDFSSLVGPEGKVHAFEPNPELWSNLVSIPNVRLWPYAVGGKISAETFFLPIGHDQVGSLVDARDFMGSVPMKTLSVLQTRVDALMEAIEKPISFMKIDVERYEEHALRGAVLTLMRDKPVVIYENHTAEIEALLSSMGFEIFEMLNDVDPSMKMTNVAAIHRDRLHELHAFLPQPDEMAAIVASAQVIADGFATVALVDQL